MMKKRGYQKFNFLRTKLYCECGIIHEISIAGLVPREILKKLVITGVTSHSEIRNKKYEKS